MTVRIIKRRCVSSLYHAIESGHHSRSQRGMADEVVANRAALLPVSLCASALPL